jgi:hypothetical protein
MLHRRVMRLRLLLALLVAIAVTVAAALGFLLEQGTQPLEPTGQLHEDYDLGG